MRRLMLSATCLGLLGTAACTPVGAPVTEVTPAFGAARADVNPTYQNGRVEMPDVKVMSLEEMESVTAPPGSDKAATPEDRLRVPAIRDAALSYGALGGLAWGSKQINQMLQADASNLSKTYDFNHFLIHEQGGVTILPPVISSSQNTYEQSDAGRTLRVADSYYQILEQARFAPVSPLWQTYLMRTFSAPEKPLPNVLPKTAAERDLWKNFVAQGWEKGLMQARETFKIDLRRLERDYTGMIRYSELLEKNMVSAPVVASTNLGVTGNGQNARIDDRQFKITQDPRLNVNNPGGYHAPVSGMDPVEAATPPGEPTGERDK